MCTSVSGTATATKRGAHRPLARCPGGVRPWRQARAGSRRLRVPVSFAVVFLCLHPRVLTATCELFSRRRLLFSRSSIS